MRRHADNVAVSYLQAQRTIVRDGNPGTPGLGLRAGHLSRTEKGSTDLASSASLYLSKRALYSVFSPMQAVRKGLQRPVQLLCIHSDATCAQEGLSHADIVVKMVAS